MVCFVKKFTYLVLRLFSDSFNKIVCTFCFIFVYNFFKNGPKETKIMEVEARFVACIIGKRGKNIWRIKTESGADILVKN